MRGWINHGVTHTRDVKGHMWVNGRDLFRWIEDQRAASKPVPMEPDQAFCLNCRRAVVMVDPILRRRGKHALQQGQCAECGAPVNRGQRHDQ
jgi:hypothetical protein